MSEERTEYRIVDAAGNWAREYSGDVRVPLAVAMGRDHSRRGSAPHTVERRIVRLGPWTPVPPEEETT